MTSVRQRFHEQMYIELRAMASHALGAGMALPSWVTETVSRLDERAAGDAPADAKEVSLTELARAHGEVAQLIAPATPELIVLLYSRVDEHRLRETFGQVRVVRSFMAVSAISTALFVLISLSYYANDPEAASFYTSSGYPLFVNEAFYIASASMGAAFSNLFQVNRAITSGTFSPRRESVYWVRYILGIVAGLLLATILNVATIAPAGGDVPASFGFSGAALALMGGFSASILEKVIQRLIDAMETVVRGSMDQEIELREQANKVQTEAALAKARMRTTRLLNDIQRRLAAGESPESLRALLDQANRSVLTNDDRPLPPPAPSPQLPEAPAAPAVDAALEVRALIEAEGGAPLARARYEIQRGGEVIASGQTGDHGEIAQPVQAEGDYEIVIFREGGTPGAAAGSAAALGGDVAGQRARAAWHGARRELARGAELHGAGKAWETAGSNRGPLVDQYIKEFMSPAAAPPWCGMFVGYNYLKAGFKTSGQIPASQTTDGRAVARKTIFMSAVRLMLYLKGKDCRRVELPTKKAAARFSTRAACAAWLDEHVRPFAPQPGDILLCHTVSGDYTHVGMVASYDPATYELVTYEGNLANRACAWRWDLADPSDLGFFRVNMIGRLAPDDFDGSCEVPPEGPSPDPVVEKGGAASAR